MFCTYHRSVRQADRAMSSQFPMLTSEFLESLPREWTGLNPPICTLLARVCKEHIIVRQDNTNREHKFEHQINVNANNLYVIYQAVTRAFCEIKISVTLIHSGVMFSALRMLSCTKLNIYCRADMLIGYIEATFADGYFPFQEGEVRLKRTGVTVRFPLKNPSDFQDMTTIIALDAIQLSDDVLVRMLYRANVSDPLRVAEGWFVWFFMGFLQSNIVSGTRRLFRVMHLHIDVEVASSGNAAAIFLIDAAGSSLLRLLELGEVTLYLKWGCEVRRNMAFLQFEDWDCATAYTRLLECKGLNSDYHVALQEDEAETLRHDWQCVCAVEVYLVLSRSQWGIDDGVVEMIARLLRNLPILPGESMASAQPCISPREVSDSGVEASASASDSDVESSASDSESSASVASMQSAQSYISMSE